MNDAPQPKVCVYCGQAGHSSHECPRRAQWNAGGAVIGRWRDDLGQPATTLAKTEIIEPEPSYSHSRACMGGWCSIRGACAHYRPGSPDPEPAERLCPPGAPMAAPR